MLLFFLKSEYCFNLELVTSILLTHSESTTIVTMLTVDILNEGLGSLPFHEQEIYLVLDQGNLTTTHNNVLFLNINLLLISLKVYDIMM